MATLLYRQIKMIRPLASVVYLSPDTFSARSRLTSELLRTLSMNGCF